MKTLARWTSVRNFSAELLPFALSGLIAVAGVLPLAAKAGQHLPHTVVKLSALGATFHAGATIFRVWSPGVDSVSVEVEGKAPVALTREPGHTDDDAVWTGSLVGVKAGDHYRFQIKRQGVTGPYADPRSEQVFEDSSGAWSVVSAPASAMPVFNEPSFNKMVIYELHVGSFHSETGTGKFDFAGVEEKLDYLQKLGVDAVELMPIVANAPGSGHVPPDFDWGYDGISIFAVNPSYGTPEALRKFVRDCHLHKIAVILDVVYNHLAPGNLLLNFGGFTLPSITNGVYFYGDDRRDSGFGPRLDYGRPQVRRYIEDNALWWLRNYGMDGLRWDSVINIRAYNNDHHFLIAEGRQVIREANDAYRNTTPAEPGKIAIAEDLQGAWDVVTPTAQGGLGFNSQWDDDFFYKIRSVVVSAADEGRDIQALAGAVKNQYGDDVFHRVIYSENHDKVGHPDDQDVQIRLPRLIDSGDPESIFAKRRSTLAAVITFTSPGIPMIFQGQEMLDTNTFTFAKAAVIDWSRPDHFPGIVQLYHDLIALRENRGGNTMGLTEQHVNVYHIDNGNHTLVYHRFGSGGAGDDVVVAANFSNKRIDSLKIGFPRGGVWHVRFNSGASTYDSGFTNGDSFDTTANPDEFDNLHFSGTLGIGPYSAVILSQ